MNLGRLSLKRNVYDEVWNQLANIYIVKMFNETRCTCNNNDMENNNNPRSRLPLESPKEFSFVFLQILVDHRRWVERNAGGHCSDKKSGRWRPADLFLPVGAAK